MSNLTICNNARDGKFNEVVDAFRKDPSVIASKDSCGRNVLHWSASGGHLELVKYLIEAGTKGDEADESGWTPLMIAVSAGRDDVAEYLLKFCSADPNAINSTGQSPLHYAASKNRLNLAKQLLAAGAQVDLRDWGGNTPLHRAVSQGHTDMVKLLLFGDASHSDLQTSSGVVKSPKASPNIPNTAGQTPLHFACEDGNASVVRLLLQVGGDLSAKDKDGKTPIELAPDHLRVSIPNELGLVR
nr:unnamed protein product [Spirometra erinaceieuropaei]